MKKSLFKNICLSLACLLGIGGITGVALTSTKEATQVSADSTYYTEKKNVLFLFDPETNKGATTLAETNNTGTWKVSRAADDGKNYYSFWRGIPSSETVTFTRNQSIKHIFKVVVYIQQFYSKDDPTYHPVKGTLSIDGKVVGTATSDGSQSSSSIFTNTVAYNGGEKDGVVKVSLNAVNSSTYSFYYDYIEIYYRAYSAIPVTLNDNGGSGGSGTINCTYAEAMPASVKVPTRPGYRFDGYYVGSKQYYKADGTRAVTNFDINAASATFTAKWTLMEFDITLDDNGGTGGQGSIKAIYGSAMPNLTTLPTRTGYTFQGYYSAKSGGTQYFDAAGKGVGTYGLTKATTVYARWEANKYNVSFDPTQGSGGITALEATYDSLLRDLNSTEIPTREPAHGHSYSFGGYYTQAPTEDENGYQTPNGKCYINDLGKSVGLWKEASDTTLYAYWTVDMTVTSSGYEGIWDNQYHGISVNVQYPEETTVYYGNQEGQCSDTNPEHFVKRDVGTYTVYFEVRKDSYTTYRHSETIVIKKANSYITSNPTAVTGLEFTNEEQALVNAGTVDYGKMLYALSDHNITDVSDLLTLTFKEEIPTAKNVGTYFVYYCGTGDSNHEETGISLDHVVEVSIAEVDKTELVNTVNKASEYLLTIVDDYQDIANELSEKISIAQGEFVDNKNVTAQQVENATNDLKSYISNAKVAVTETKINAIGSLSYPDSQALIDEAKDYFDNVLNDIEKGAVDPSLSSLLNNDYNVYYGAKQLADLINAIPEASESQAYFDAVDAAKALYDELQENNPDAITLLFSSTEANYQKIFEDNVASKNVIELISKIGEVSYEEGVSDSSAAINLAQEQYALLTDDQKAIVNGVNYETLVHDAEVYSNVNDVADLIKAIPAESESQEYYDAVDAAKAAYNALSEEEKAIINATVSKDFDKILNDQVAVREVIELIQNIGEVTYNGGENDSSADIIAAKLGYTLLSDEQKEIVNGVNYSDLDHKATVYEHIDDVASLIEAIPEPSDTQAYYDAVKAANDAYKSLSDEEKAIINAAENVNYEKVLEDNVLATEVIKEIQAIGEVTYNKGDSDSLSAIESAETHYANLTEDQKTLVDLANKDDLDHDREVYDNVDATVDLINAIGEVSHTEENDSKEALDAARTAYDALSEEEKALVSGYNDSVKTLEDDEAVYEVMVKIDDIGAVSYSTESEELINKAREVYESLTEDQKAQLGDEYFDTLTTAETRYSELKKTANIWVIILLIVASLAIVGGIWLLIVLLKKKKNNNDDQNGNSGNSKKEPVKALSIGGLLPFAILTSNYLSGPWLALYAVAGVAVLLWIAIMIIAIVKKNKKKKAALEASKVKANESSTSEDEEESVTITDEAGNVFNIRFVKSFTAKLIQSPEETKKYYEELKNEVLSYKKTNSRVSWHYDAVNAGREYVLKFAIRGKTLGVYFPLNADDYADSKYKVEKTNSKKYEDVPCLYRIKNDRRCEYAKELIAVVASNLGLEKGEEQHEVYSNLPYESNKPLIARGLIKELKIQVNKPVETVIETKEDEEGNEVVVSQDNLGNKYETRYLKSFTAKLSQASDELKEYYNELKNYSLSFSNASSRVSWNYDTINVNNKGVLKFVIKRKNLYLYYALDTSKIGQKYKVEHVEYKKYEDVPTVLMVDNDKRKELSKELINRLMRQNKCELGKNLNDEYRIPFESKEALIQKGLIKEVKIKIQ